MPLPVFVQIRLGNEYHLCRVVKNEFCDFLRTLDAHAVLQCRATLSEMIVFTDAYSREDVEE